MTEYYGKSSDVCLWDMQYMTDIFEKNDRCMKYGGLDNG